MSDSMRDIRRSVARAVFLFSLAAGVVFGPGVRAERPSIEDLAGFATHEEAVISPSGKYLALTRRIEGAERIVIVDVDSRQARLSRGLGKDNEIYDIRWDSWDRLIFQPLLYARWRRDYRIRTGELLAMDPVKGRIALVYGYRAGAVKGDTELNVSVRSTPRSTNKNNEPYVAYVLDILPDDRKHIVIQANPFYRVGPTSYAYRLDIFDGSLVQLAKGEGRRTDFYSDQRGSIVLRRRALAGDGVNIVEYRSGSNQAFREVLRTEETGARLFLLYSSDNPGWFFGYDDRGFGTDSFVEWNPEKNSVRLLYRHPEVDVEEAMRASYYRKVYALRLASRYPEYVYLLGEHPLAVAHQLLRATFPGKDIAITSATSDLSKAVVLVSGDRDPGVFFLLDIQTQKLVRIAERRPELRGKILSEMRPVEFSARDGLRVRGYLTLPPGSKGKQPLVVFVHPGPYGSYDEWGFQPEVQLLASRGFAVLQVNYRGSGGRGREFRLAGYGEWGRKMQDDITDATRWAVESGFADESRICIFGQGYGAYAALTGVFREPGLYQCSIGLSGVYDVLLDSPLALLSPRTDDRYYFPDTTQFSKEELMHRSPVHNAGRIEAAVLLAHGRLDRRAPIKHAYRMKRALEKAGVPVQWHFESRESHGFDAKKNRIEFYTVMLEFLDRHIGAGHKTAANAQAGN